MIGTQLGPYRIDDRLGEGGMGVVYRAWDVRLERQVALKVLPTGIRASDDSRQRLAREARAAATLNHPNIATVYDIGEAEGHLYIAIELVEGVTLAEHAGGRPMDVAEVRHIGSQVARGLAAAHAAGVVHRDVKPGNVMVRPDGVVKLLDFGLAKQEGAEELTKQGSTVGTVAYMSPEQARAEEAGPESDLWSLGVMLYELVTGERPFAGTYETAILYAVMNEVPRAPGETRPDCPDDLNDLVVDLLTKERSGRPADASAVAERLSGATATPVTAVGTGFALSRRLVAVVVTAVVVVLAVVGIRWGGQASDRRWVEREGLPLLREIGPLSAAAPVAIRTRAFEVARRVLETEPTADSLRAMYVVRLSLHSVPEGASVSMMADSAGHRVWRPIGTTPLVDVLIPYGFDDVRLELAGYDLLETNLIARQDLADTLKLVATGTVPPGMTMGESTYERPLRLPGLEHIVRPILAPFAIDRFEVTNARFQAFVDDGGYGDPAWWTVPVVRDGQVMSFEASRALFTDETGRPGPATWSAGRYPSGEDDYPVRGVSWYEAAAFAAWDGGQLPTVFHWEAAAVPGLAEHLMNTANIGYREGPLPVGASGSMGFGLYDGAGNVREWVWNREPNRNLRFVLGGAWSDDPYRFVDAYAANPLERDPGTGFRTMAADADADPELRRPLSQPFRDYTRELPVTDLEYERMVGFFAYDPQPLDALETLIDSTDADVSVWRVEHDAGYGERIYAFLYLPKRSRAPYQPIVYFPGDGNWNAGVPAVPFEPGFVVRNLARDGRAVMAPVFRNTNDRLGALATSTPDMSVSYRDHVVMWSKEVRRSVDYLATRTDMDMERLSFFGWSWGSMMAPAMIATEPRFKVSVLYVGGLLFQPSRPEVDMFNHLPRVTIPTLMVNGRYDFYFPYLTSQKPFFDHLGAPDSLKELKVYDGAHGAPPGVVLRETITWLDRFLGPPGR